MALVGTQQVHLAATVDGGKPAFSASPFPTCDVINAANPFPQSPSPVWTLLTQNIVGGPYPYTPTVNYPHANCAIDVAYNTGAFQQQSTIYVVESYSTVVAGL